MAHATQAGADTVIMIDGAGSIRLSGINLSTLVETNFLFG